MSSAVNNFQGRFDRVALLDMNVPLVGHAHHHCHMPLKVGGADHTFVLRGQKGFARLFGHSAAHRAHPGGDTARRQCA